MKKITRQQFELGCGCICWAVLAAAVWAFIRFVL